MDWLETETTVQPTVEPISMDEARAQCRIDPGDATEETLLTAYIKAAREEIERLTGTRLITQTVKFRRAAFCDVLHLPLGPVQSISSITYLDSAGAEQTLSSSIYTTHLTGLSPAIYRKYGQNWPTTYSAPDAVRITAVAGYGAAGSNVPENVRLVAKQLIAGWYDNRSIGDVPPGLRKMLNNDRIFAF